ncbi:peptidoglycan-associated lipoprotein Pal [Rodentibacter pneumotropicus]|uniref:Peptidoglycan-associated lipoprotein n=1 Tax=Rodentibacter pneumotropicus TaxID=758 RepID=A0A4S2Q4M8_9PAST|nr:peptidoglycan-associated lipoprotein Pal [Rodentibacter pneumotropicus]TGZ98571.1 peptidoglycan-associated lipoprotein Pal [Rodentibacter pneumotropicus]THA01396.1 peptidoglycan-associated lipoprotein Pal [Rodentibacter pneumotropicus]THA05476.1 peptidoglycan-associated lipoprotein Pal [Rodentibacter pneumotropicus]THA11572.1 peptidoglycan-associated lipoprotein Pal [Rodentibacter pneumotropicus]
MNKFVKSLLVAGSVAALAACSSSSNDAAGNGAATNGQTFGGYSVEDLQQRYNTVYFGFDKYNIEGEYVQILDAHAAYLNATPASKVIVEGNTDERGTPEYNIALGQRRADAVKSFLADKGVEGSKVSTVSYGEEKPAVLGHDEAAYSKNRRAVLSY